MVKYADDTTVIGLISDNNEAAHREEVQNLMAWWSSNNLVINTKKIREIIVDFRSSRKTTRSPIHINANAVERVPNIRFLGVMIIENLSWAENNPAVVGKTQQCQLRKANLQQKLLVSFYRSTIESILTNCMSVGYSSCTQADKKPSC